MIIFVIITMIIFIIATTIKMRIKTQVDNSKQMLNYFNHHKSH